MLVSQIFLFNHPCCLGRLTSYLYLPLVMRGWPSTPTPRATLLGSQWRLSAPYPTEVVAWLRVSGAAR